MKITIEGRKWANLNGSHQNHYAHQALMNAWKDIAILAIRKARPVPVQTPVTITATVRRVKAGRADAHNVMPSIKACIDAAVDCGVIPDDHDGYVSRLIIEPGAKASAPTIELLIEPTPDARPCQPVFRSRTRCGEPICETHDEPWPCPESEGDDE